MLVDLPYCLQNIIGVSPQCLEMGVRHPDFNFPDPPKSGLYITDLEGISLNMSSKIVNGEDITGINLIRKKIQYATKLVLDDFARYLNPHFRLNSVLDSVKLGRYPSPMSFINDGSTALRGVKVERTISTLYRIRLVKAEFLTILPSPTATLELIIRDGNLEKRIPFRVTDRQVSEIYVNYPFQFDDGFVLVDNFDLQPSDSYFDITSGYEPGCSSCNSTYSSRISPYQSTLRVTGWDGVQESSSSYGLTLTFAIECDISQFYCTVSSFLYRLFLLKSGIELAKEWLHSERINEFTTIKKPQASFLIEEWTAEYEAIYKHKIQEVMQAIRQMDCGCITCRGNQYHYQI